MLIMTVEQGMMDVPNVQGFSTSVRLFWDGTKKFRSDNLT